MRKYFLQYFIYFENRASCIFRGYTLNNICQKIVHILIPIKIRKKYVFKLSFYEMIMLYYLFCGIVLFVGSWNA